jgi:hypothetical protein
MFCGLLIPVFAAQLYKDLVGMLDTGLDSRTSGPVDGAEQVSDGICWLDGDDVCDCVGLGEVGTVFSEAVGTVFAEDVGTVSAEDVGTVFPEDVGTVFAEDAGTVFAEDVGTVFAEAGIG